MGWLLFDSVVLSLHFATHVSQFESQSECSVLARKLDVIVKRASYSLKRFRDYLPPSVLLIFIEDDA